MLTARLYMLQRITAVIMAPLVLVHLALMIYAVQGGLSAAEILGRTQGSILWAIFYSTFVLAAAIHAAIGLRVIVQETMKGWNFTMLTVFTWSNFLLLAILGLTAVFGVISPGGITK